ncbi:MAG: hypothetical protein IKU76_07075 [Bacteroidaceae bacterium]|nr:hypothetical protein [Bacteroidaceae bacterium]
MSIDIDSPQIAALREEIEELVGKMYSHSNFTHLSGLIGYKCKEYISVTTLERIWGYSTRNASKISVRTLDVIARFVDCSNWESYCKRLNEMQQRSSDVFQTAGAINNCDLAIGTRVRIAWQPDRVCVVEYLGGNRYVAVECDNSRMRPGDTFTCLTMQKGRELYMDNFTRCGEESAGECYVVGQISGLTAAEIIKD